MEDNVYAQNRYKQANDRLVDLISAMEKGQLDEFGKIVEDEALTLHALMMCSQPSYILIEPNSLNIINAVRNYRKQTGVPVFFSLDAGPNIHLLYPDSNEQVVKQFIEEDLKKYCLQIIPDKVGGGPVKLS
jgi:diphosphomevalonate decarboxylase